jgi:hypothetical protein
MRLPAHIIQQIVGHPVARFSGSGHKRALGRVELQTTATICTIQSDLISDPIDVTLRDISAETVGMTTPSALMPSTSILLTIPMPKSKELAIRCRVTRCIRTQDGDFALAAQFVTFFDPKTLDAMSPDRN